MTKEKAARMHTQFRSLLATLALTLFCSAAALAAGTTTAGPTEPASLAQQPVVTNMLLAYGDVDIWDETGQIIKGPPPAKR